MQNRFKWYGVFAALLVVCGGGLVLGKYKERDYLSSLYERHDFTLLDDNGEFFRLNSSLPARKLALLVFTPDGIPPSAVKPFAAFSQHVGDLRDQGIETILVSRTNREIVKNFKQAARFSSRLLLDAGGTVGRSVGVWPTMEAVPYWAYALVDREFKVYWQATGAREPIAYQELMGLLRKAK